MEEWRVRRKGEMENEKKWKNGEGEEVEEWSMRRSGRMVSEKKWKNGE